MEVVSNNYLPGDQHLIDKIVYELKAQGIFDQFRKECFADVDTKPAYQNLRQRVEGSVMGFLREQSWKPDMNKNQVREMLRKTITESGYLETGVERIVDQVVNPKINTVFLPKVEEVVYSYLGIKKPIKIEVEKGEHSDLLPTDLEAVSPESEPVDKKDDKSSDNLQDIDESKTEEDESPPFEPLDEQNVYVPQEENSVDSHMSGFSGLVSHESNQSNENKTSQMEQDSQMSRNSSDSRLSIVTSDENSKMDLCEDSQSKSIKSSDSSNDKNKPKTSDRHKSRSESKSDKDKDRKSSKDSKSRHSSSSKDKDKSRDRKDSKSTSSGSKSDKSKDRGIKSSSSSSSKHSSGSKRDKDRSHSSSTHKSSDSKSKEKSSSSDKHKHSSHGDRHKKDKDKKRDRPKDDHYSSKDKRNDRRSTDRDSNDGHSSRSNPPPSSSASDSSQTQKSSTDTPSKSDSGNTQSQDHTTKAPVILTGAVEKAEVTIAPSETQRVKVLKPKYASNIQEALRLIKIRKQLAKLEKQNQLSLASVDVNSPILMSSSINLDDLKPSFEKNRKRDVAEIEMVPSPLQNTVISQDSWDAMEAKLRQEVCTEFKDMNDDSSHDESCEQRANRKDLSADDDSVDCKYFEMVDVKKIEFLQFAAWFIKEVDKVTKGGKTKRKLEDNDLKNNNRQVKLVPEKKARRCRDKLNNHLEIPLNGKFPLPLSPAESEKSVDKKEEPAVPLKVKRNSINKANNQRYSSDDLYKPRPTFTSSRRRGAKNADN